jgi:hypothetical protein
MNNGYPMSKKLAGIKVSGDALQVVVLTQDAAGDFTFVDQTTLTLQDGDLPPACHTLHVQLVDYLKHQKVGHTCIIGSAVTRHAATLALLHSAELRGVAMAAAATVTDTKVATKASISRTWGDRKFEEYIKDDEFWRDLDLLKLKKGMREAALVVISQFKH